MSKKVGNKKTNQVRSVSARRLATQSGNRFAYLMPAQVNAIVLPAYMALKTMEINAATIENQNMLAAFLNVASVLVDRMREASSQRFGHAAEAANRAIEEAMSAFLRVTDRRRDEGVWKILGDESNVIRSALVVAESLIRMVSVNTFVESFNHAMSASAVRSSATNEVVSREVVETGVVETEFRGADVRRNKVKTSAIVSKVKDSARKNYCVAVAA